MTPHFVVPGWFDPAANGAGTTQGLRVEVLGACIGFAGRLPAHPFNSGEACSVEDDTETSILQNNFDIFL
jgi:hypothetical protein